MVFIVRRRTRAAVRAKKATRRVVRTAKSATHRVKTPAVHDVHIGHKNSGHERRVNAPKGW